MMKKFLLVFIVFLLWHGYSQNQIQFQSCGTSNQQNGVGIILDEDPTCNTYNYYLVYSDEFDGNTLDLNKWGIRPWGQGEFILNSDGSYSNVQGYYTLDNVDVSNGTCKIYGKHETVIRKAVSWLPENEILSDGFQNLRTFNFTAANIWSKKKMESGYYEIKCKIPKCGGTGVAFWNYDNHSTHGWNELDCFEIVDDGTTNSRKTYAMNMHHHDHTEISDDDLSCQSSYNSGIDFSDDFHVFGVKWSEYKIEWYVDGQLVRLTTKLTNMLGQTVNCSSVSANQPYLLDRAFIDKFPMYLIFSLGISSNGSDNPPNISSFPALFEIDYIRFWKQIDCGANIQIDNSNMIDPNLFNFYNGSNISVSNNVTLPSDQQLNLSATESIILEPGFTTENNSFFEAKIESNLCSNGFSGYIDYGENGNEAYNTNANKYLKIDNSINVFPNPTSNIINITGDNIVKVCIQNMNGKILKTLNFNNNNQIVINLDEFSKGIYYITIPS
jgi:beta-glucanase (GH16 family)